jgi:multidrug efflux pump subunit AcrA (membrane-fusion protein)
MRKKIIITITILILGISIFRIVQSINKKTKISKQLKDTDVVYTVKVVKVKYEKIFDSANFVGEIKGINEVSVYSKVPGKLAKKIVDEGEFVTKDTTICEIDRDEPVLKYALYELKSPISGVISKYFVDIGGIVSPQMPVCNISDTSQIRVVFGIAEKLVSKINSWSYIKFKTTTYPDKTFYGKNLQLGNYIDPVSRLMEIKSIISNDNNIFRSGSFVEGEIIFNEKNVLVLPIDCIVNTFDNKKIVYVIENDVASKKEVKTGLEYRCKVEIIYGSKTNDLVVHQGQELLTEGKKVNIIE